MTRKQKKAAELHKNVPPDWYHQSIKRNLLQRLWHTVRFREVAKSLEPVSGKVLDIGSADGVFSKVIYDKTNPKQYIGIDVLKTSVDWSNKHWKNVANMHFEVGDAHKLKFNASTFDAVIALEVLEHIEDPDMVFNEIFRVLKKGGYTIILVPTDNTLFKIVWWFVTKFWWAKIWNDTHVQSFDSKNTLAKNLKKSGFKIDEDRKFWFGMLSLVKARKPK